MRTKPFSELRQGMTPERRAKNQAYARLMLLHLNLLEQLQLLNATGDDLEAIYRIEKVIADIESKLENPENTIY
ncbi:MAG: hypothetical protein QNJ51_19380 [Calothrix sp. MO_167.B12]|nr:hypothetical protein [Calothrix sp. MO_167.B12]